jgi:hypothetical protein
MQASELARAVGYLIAHELTAHQREVLLALTIDEITAHDLATRLHSTPGAVYKTLHDARRKLKYKLPPDQQLPRFSTPRPLRSGRASQPPEWPRPCLRRWAGTDDR